MEFSSLGSFAVHLLKLEVTHRRSVERGLELAAKAIEDTAKSEFGTYQPAVGDFPAWAPLSPWTQDERVRHGYTPDDPLLRSGALRDSIGHSVQGDTAVIGSKSPAMVVQELGGELHSPTGTSLVPPRPVLGPAGVRSKESVQRILGHALLEGLLPDNHVGAPGGPTQEDYSHKV